METTKRGARRLGTQSAPSQRAGTQESSQAISPIQALASSSWEYGILLTALIVGTAIYVSFPDLVYAANIFVPVSLVLALGLGCFRMAQRKVATILTPLFCFRVSLLFYSGLGSLVPVIGGEDEIAVIQAFFYFSDYDLLKFNIVNLTFVLFINLSTLLAAAILARLHIDSSSIGKESRLIEPANVSLLVVGLAILFLGSFVYFVFIIPYQFGMGEGTVPQALAQVALSSQIGLFLCTIWSLQNKPKLAWLFVSVAVLMSLIGLTTYSKSDVILPLIMIGAAYIYASPTAVRSLAWLSIILGSFALSQPVTAHGRMVLFERYGAIEGPAGITERSRIILEYYTEPVEIKETEANYAVIRFSYVNIGAFAIAEADSGNYVDTYSRAWAIFIPRLLWPEKPNMTQIGRDINFAITGNDQSAVGTGMSAEAYWNGGLSMVMVGGLIVGTILWLWSIYSIQVQVVGAWHLFPIILLGVRAGVRSDGMFVTDIIGPIFVAVVGHIILSFGNRLIQRFRTG